MQVKDRTVSFGEVRSSFETIWTEGREEFWYQKAWSILARKGLTKYKTENEKHLVFVRAMVLSDLYVVFCHYAFGEEREWDYAWKLELSDIAIGQMLAEVGYQDIFEDYDDARQDAVRVLMKSQRQSVIEALTSELESGDLLAYMYFTAFKPTFMYEDVDEEGETREFEDEVSVSCYEEYLQMVEGYTEDLLDGSIGDELQAAFDWIYSGMPDIL